MCVCIYIPIHILDSRAGRDDDEDRKPTKIESRRQYRRREDQYPFIEMHP